MSENFTAPWLLSGDSAATLRDKSALLRNVVENHPSVAVEAIGRALAGKTGDEGCRAALLGDDLQARYLAAGEFASGEPGSDYVRGTVKDDRRVVLVFPGQGWQWHQMAKGLLESSPVFADRLRECDEALRPYVGQSVVEAIVRGANGPQALDDVEVMQPSLWAVMVSLARLWEASGVIPAAVVGHSQGETAAAVVSGALSLRDGARIVSSYARVIKSELSGRGGMASLGLTAEQAAEQIAGWSDELSIAVVNGPASTVISGAPRALDALVASCQRQGIWARRIAMDYAPHSAQVEASRRRLMKEFSGISVSANTIPFYSTVTGGLVEAGQLDAEYWFANLRSPIRFDRAMGALLNDGFRIFVEASAHPVLAVGMQECFDAANVDAIALGTLRRAEGGPRRFVTSLSQLWTHGAEVDWSVLWGTTDAIALPEEFGLSVVDTETVPNALGDLMTMDTAAQHSWLCGLVRRHAAAILGEHDPRDLPDDLAFADAGFDSPRAVELGRSLNGATGLRLPAAVLFSCPTPAALAERIRRELLGETRPVETPEEPEPDLGEPLAIVGMACRLPGGVQSPEELWQFVAAGGDAVADFPTDRGWDLERLYDPDGQRPGSSYVKQAAMLHEAARFDPGFFGISPREAAAMEPQQRVMLEISWEALERAGVVPSSLKGTTVGVFTGAVTQEYAARLDQAPDGYEGQILTGTTASVLSGRVAYTLGLEGPAVSVDTACSSSLVALHFATQSLRSGDCSMALVGGVTIMPNPGMFVEFSKQGGLAPDGRCKSFAATADGTNWAEGAGVLVVERLSEAKRREHPVLAVIKSSAINQDGASNGMAAPNGASQERVIRQALARASLETDEVDVVEAHGTGTKLGDPIEAQALLATYGQGRQQDDPLWLGSLKSNLGHTQAAAGVAGIIKMVMAMRHGQLPRTLHADDPTPFVDWDSGAVELLAQSREWPRAQHPRRAAVSSFGISGTNTHVILEESQDDTPAPAGQSQEAAPLPLVLSGRGRQALRQQARRLAEHVWERPEPLRDLAYSLAATRTRFSERAVVIARDHEQLRDRLNALAADEKTAGVVQGTADGRSARPVFVFPGQGAQWIGMGKELASWSEPFASAFDECDAAFRPHLEMSLWDILDSPLDKVELIQPALFAIMVSLARLWQSHGVEPAAVVGHSQGEVAAAVISGVLSMEDAATIVAKRAELLARNAEGRGGMLSVGLSADEVSPLIAQWDGELSIACLNSPWTTVVAGAPADLERLAEKCAATGIRAQRVAMEFASHSPHMESMRESLPAAIRDIRPRRGSVPFFSTVTGELTDGAQFDADYWYRNIRETVRLDPVIRKLLEEGHDSFVEVSSHPVLHLSLTEIAEHQGVAANVVGTLHRDDDTPDRFLEALAKAEVRGCRVDWVGSGPARKVDLPTYPFQRQRYWLNDTGTRRPANEDPLETVITSFADDSGVVVTATLSPTKLEWLGDHFVDGRAVLPNSAFVELALRAGDVVGCSRLEELAFPTPLFLNQADPVEVQVLVGESSQDGSRSLSIHSRSRANDISGWTTHVTGLVSAHHNESRGGNDWSSPSDVIDTSEMYAAWDSMGHEYGAAFQGVTAVWHQGEDIHAEVALPSELREQGASYRIHPALLDAALQSLVLRRPRGDSTDTALWMSALSGLELHAHSATAVRVTLSFPTSDTARAQLTDTDGNPVATIDSLVLGDSPRDNVSPPLDHLFDVNWRPADEALATPSWQYLTADLASLTGTLPEVVVIPYRQTDVEAAVLSAFRLVKEWLSQERFAKSRMAFCLPPGEPAAEAVAGLVRSAATENPGRFGIIHTHDRCGDSAIATLAKETEVSVDQGQVAVPRLARHHDGNPKPLWSPDETVLITGGTGVLGALLARHLVAAHGVRHLLLASRSGLSASGAGELATELADMGAEVRIVECDVSQRDSVRDLLERADPRHPVTAVIHTAGMLDDGVVTGLSDEQMSRVLRSKAVAAAHLDELTADHGIKVFAMFSSVASILGTAGQANYAAANSYLNGLARARQRAGLPAVSIAWGLWKETSSMTGHLTESDVDRLSRTGFGVLNSDQALALFDAAVGAEEPVVLAAPLLRSVLREQADRGELPTKFAQLIPSSRKRAAEAEMSTKTTLRDQLAASPAAERHRQLVTLTLEHARDVLRMNDHQTMGPSDTFREAGFDSLTALELRDRLNSVTGLRLPAPVIFRHPTPEELARRMEDEMFADAATVTETVASESTILASLERLHDRLDGDGDAADNAAVASRLRAMLRKLGAAESNNDDLDEASDDEMFALIDKELGFD